MLLQEQRDLHEAIINKLVTNFVDKGASVEFSYKGKSYTAQAIYGTWDITTIKEK